MKRMIQTILAAAVFAAGITLTPHARAASASAGGAQADIVDTAVAAGKFTTLAAALKAAGLIEALKGDGPFTVFAPTDDAFAKLPPGTVGDLLKPENKQKLVAVLKYHVVSGKVDAAAASKLSEAATLQGGKLSIKTDAGKVKINDATVVGADVAAKNGIIHVIDAVLLPKE